MVSLLSWYRSLLAALIFVVPISGALAQDQRDQNDQAQPGQPPQGQQPQHPPAPQHPGPVPPHPNAPPPAQHPAQGTVPQVQHAAPGPTPQVQAQPNLQHAPPAGQAAPPLPTAAHGNFSGGNFQGGTARGNNVQSNAASGHTAPPAPNAAFAGHPGGPSPAPFAHGQFYGHDFAHFTPHDRALWQGGAWHHEQRDGRYGWWYVVDGVWYFYDAPIYPYPTYIPDIVYVPDAEEIAPPPPAVEAPPPPESLPPAAASYYYYFCPDTQTYYPYVTSCASPWQQVSPTPPQ